MGIASLLKDKSILITGGTGSFGRAFAKWLLQEGSARRIIIFSRDEWKQWEMKNSSDPIFNDPKMRYFLGDVRDKDRLLRAFHDVDIVVHAAALKQVPAAEYNPSEFIKTNVLGAMNVIDAAIECNVNKVIALSTDKAVNPVNLYGATKLCSDKLFVAGNSYVGMGETTFSVVRYGNVAGTRGSVIPFWQKLFRENSPFLPITDTRMTRFWISLQEAVEFVANCLNEAQGGEIFVPKIPSFFVKDLAKIIAPHAELKDIGIREGEKLHELMIGTDDSRHTLELNNHYIIVPEMFTRSKERLEEFLNGRNGKKLADGFSFTSDNNEKWISNEELKIRLEKVLKDENL